MIVAAVFLIISPMLGLVLAQEDFSITCPDDEEPVIDLDCQRRRVLNPDASCTLLYCSGDNVPGAGPEFTDAFEFNIFNFFNVKIRVNSAQTVASLLYIGAMGFLGFCAIAAVGLGVYGAYRRSSPKDEDIAASAKILTNVLVGLILIVMSLVFSQLVASLLGLGSLTQMVDISPIFADEPVQI